MALPRPKNIEDSILVTHKSCMDGAGCAVVFMRAGGKRENIRFVAAGMVEKFIKDDPVFETDKFIIFADIGLNLPKYSERLEKRGDLVVLDHHKTSLHMKDRSWACIRMDACGTELLRRYLSLDPTGDLIPEEDRETCRFLAEVIDDHDRWLLKIPEAMDLAMFMVFVGQLDFIQRYSKGRTVSKMEELFTDFEQDLISILKRRRDESIEHAIKHSRVRDVFLDNRAFRIAYVISDEPNTSLMLHRLLEAKPDVQVAAQLMVGHAKVSLRSRGDFDVSSLAQVFGGGGHAAAAGHIILPSAYDEFISEVHR